MASPLKHFRNGSARNGQHCEPSCWKALTNPHRFVEWKSTSPTEANNHKELEKRSHRFARYADDFTVMVRSPRAARRVKESITRFLKKKLREYIRGWMGYFGRSEYYRPIPALDEWLRRRMRMCYWKQWRKSRKRISQLIQLGANERYAIQTGLSRKGYWRLSRTLATNSGMTNRWLEEQGLISIRELWIGIHYPATAR